MSAPAPSNTGVSSVAGYGAAGFEPIAGRVARRGGVLAHEAYNFDVAERKLWRARIAEWFSDADIENGSAWDG